MTAAVGFVVLPESIPGQRDRGNHERRVLHEVVAERDDDARRQRQLGAEALEHRRERRDDLPQDDADDDARNHDDRDRVNHRGLDLALQLDGFFDVDRKALQNRVENTARFAGGNHVRVEVVERVREPPHRVGERRAAFNGAPRLQNDFREILVFFLVAQNVETLHERQARVDHDGELPREHGEVLRGNGLVGLAAARLLDFSLRGLFFGRLDLGDLHLLAPQRGDRGIHRVGDALARDCLAGARPSRVGKCGHSSAR